MNPVRSRGRVGIHIKLIYKSFLLLIRRFDARRPRPASNGMKAVILAAGEGKRMRPLTETTPKPMLLVAGKPLLLHIINSLPEEINEIILIVGYLSNQIKDYFGNTFERFKIHYIDQDLGEGKKYGTAHAFSLCRSFIKNEERFLVMYADDLHSKKIIKKALMHPLSLLIQEVQDPRRFGIVTLDKNDYVQNIIEKPENPSSRFANVGIYILDSRIFDYPLALHPNGEYYLSEIIGKMAHDHKIKAMQTDFWFPVACPEDLKKAEEYLKEKSR